MYRESWVEDVVEVDREQVKESFTPCSRGGIAGVVNVSPGISSLREAAVGKLVEDTLDGGGGRKVTTEWIMDRMVSGRDDASCPYLVRVLLTTHEDKMFQCVGKTVVIMGLSS